VTYDVELTQHFLERMEERRCLSPAKLFKCFAAMAAEGSLHERSECVIGGARVVFKVRWAGDRKRVVLLTIMNREQVPAKPQARLGILHE